MAVDTRNKRSSAIYLTEPWRNQLPTPTGTTTFDPLNTGTGLALSNGNLTITTTGGGASVNNRHTRSIASYSTGKYYAEFTLTQQAGGSGTQGVGVLNAALPATTWIGDTFDGFGYWDDGSVYRNSGVIAAIGGYTTGDVISMAVDATARLVWWRKNNQAWNNNGGDDPSTGAGGIDISQITGALYAGAEGDTNGCIWTANFGATAYTQSVPSGFGNWGGVTSTIDAAARAQLARMYSGIAADPPTPGGSGGDWLIFARRRHRR